MLPGSVTFRNYASVWCKTDKLEVAAGLCWAPTDLLCGHFRALMSAWCVSVGRGHVTVYFGYMLTKRNPILCGLKNKKCLVI